MKPFLAKIALINNEFTNMLGEVCHPPDEQTRSHR
jgi:hypothetical protein